MFLDLCNRKFLMKTLKKISLLSAMSVMIFSEANASNPLGADDPLSNSSSSAMSSSPHPAPKFSIFPNTDELLEQQDIMNVIVFEGGGTRGVVGLTVLAYLEGIIGKPVSEFAHLIVGTSIGAFETALLTTINPRTGRPYSAEECLNILAEEGKSIFKPNVLSVGGLLESKYSSGNLRDACSKYIPANATMEQGVCPNSVAAYDTVAQEVKMLSSWGPEHFCTIDAILGSGAMPGYFGAQLVKPVAVDGLEEEELPTYTLEDGGIGACNPILQAKQLAASVYPFARHIRLVSFGTGIVDAPKSYEQVENVGKLSLLTTLTDEIWNAYQNAEDQYMPSACQDFKDGGEYWRLNPIIPSDYSPLDAPDNMGKLGKIAEKYIHDNSSQLQRLADRLAQPVSRLEMVVKGKDGAVQKRVVPFELP